MANAQNKGFQWTSYASLVRTLTLAKELIARSTGRVAGSGTNKTSWDTLEETSRPM